MAKASAPKGAKTSLIQPPVMTEVSYFIHYVPEAEWKKAISFFQDTIGLMLRTDTGQGWAEFRAGGLTFALHSAKEPKPKETGICFAVSDCDLAVEQLRNRGVKGVTDPKKVSDEGRVFEFKDPFGNTFSAYGK